MSNIDTGINTGRGFEGMEEQRQDLGGSPGGVRGMASKAGEKIMDTAEKQKAVGADYVDTIAGAVRRAAGEFDGQVPQAADYIRYAADQMESLSDSFRRRDISQMMQDVQSFARRQPTAFLGLGFLAGFAAVRFLRSGAPGAGPSASGGDWQNQDDTGRHGASSHVSSSSSSAGAGSWQGSRSTMEDDDRLTSTPGMAPGTGL